MQVVFKYDPTSDVLYGGESLDITADVIKGLNEAYGVEKNGTASKTPSKTAAKADTTTGK